jgi:AhpD family alkylhydroperoxidase
MKKFSRRLYASPGEFWVDIRYILGNRPDIHKAMRGELISPAFRERLMLMVTQVNGCRYCSYFHAQEALKTGISNQELKSLLKGVLPEDAPEEEIPALLYAQHWAESNAHPEPETDRRLIETYRQEKVAAIQVILRMIRVGNLLGNLGDYVLFRLSFGRWGQSKKEFPELTSDV